MDLDTLARIVVVFVLVFANGFFVAAEFSLVSVRRSRIEQLVEEGSKPAQVVQRTLNKLDGAIAATQLGITMASLALGWAGEPALAHLIEPVFFFLPPNLAFASGHALATAIAFAIITTLHIVLGELAPKTLALQRTEQTALMVAGPLELFHRIFRPFIAVLNGAGNYVVRLFGLQPTSGHESIHSVEELELIVRSSSEAGVLDEAEAQLLGRVFGFGDRSAEQIMTPRTQMIAVPLESNIDDLIAIARDTSVSRVPVYDGSVDNVVGMVHLKDLFQVVPRNGHVATASFSLKSLLRPIMDVPGTIKVDQLLLEMRRRRQHLALVVDEWGGTAGLVTLEDILEEIVGDVRDEFDVSEPEETIVSTDDGALVDGLVPIDVVNDRFGLSLDESDFDTIGGFVFGALGHVAQVGDHVTAGPYQLEVVKVDGRRIERVRFRKSEE